MNKEELMMWIRLFSPILRSYALGFGLFVGLLFFIYGLFLLFALFYECKCEATNLAVFMKTNMNEDCLRYAENKYSLTGYEFNNTPDIYRMYFDENGIGGNSTRINKEV